MAAAGVVWLDELEPDEPQPASPTTIARAAGSARGETETFRGMPATVGAPPVNGAWSHVNARSKRSNAGGGRLTVSPWPAARC